MRRWRTWKNEFARVNIIHIMEHMWIAIRITITYHIIIVY